MSHPVKQGDQDLGPGEMVHSHGICAQWMMSCAVVKTLRSCILHKDGKLDGCNSLGHMI